MAKTKTPGSKKPTQKPEDDNTEDQDGTDGEGDDEGDDSDDTEAENRRINAIVTSRVKREMKGVLAQLSTLTDAISKISPAKKADDDDDDDDDGEETESKKEAKIDPKLSRKMNKLERELADEREARKKAEKATADEAEKAKRTEMVSQFDAALAEHGVTDPRLRRAALMSLEADGVMVRDDETGKIKFKGQDKYGIETLYDPKVGLKQWVLSEGKSFVPAVDAGGSGTGGARQGAGNSNISRGEFGKLSPQAKAAIELERASMGLPPLE